MRYGELFAGAGGMSLGLDRAGLTPVFHAELADFPRRLLTHHWPDVPLYGDVSALDGRQLVRDHGPIDLLAGGSPCQDLSVAGKRAGLEGARSGLFFEQIRLWEETGATYLLWENVAGALSSNSGKDFAAVLSAIVGSDVGVQPKGWRVAGVAAGPTGVAAWRLIDAQWFGVPQRRLRVFVLGARAGGVDPATVLLEPEGVRRNPPTRGEAREGAASGVGDGTDRTLHFNAYQRTVGGVASPLTAGDAKKVEVGVLAFHRKQDPIHGEDFSPALGVTSEGMGVLAFDLAQITSAANRSRVSPELPAPTLNQAGQVHVCATGEVTHALTAEGHDAGEDGTGRGTPIIADVMEPLLASMHRGPGHNRDGHVVIGTLDSREHGGGFPGSDGAMAGHVQASAGIPRRLMPIECERLMGWPDRWTAVPDEKGKPASDAVRYKACGNGVVSHCSEWIGHRLAFLESLAPSIQQLAA